jgi:hypothetical protein
MTTMFVTAVTHGETYGELLADGMFAGKHTTNLIIYCGKEYAATAAELLIESPDAPVMVDLDDTGNVIKVYLCGHEFISWHGTRGECQDCGNNVVPAS